MFTATGAPNEANLLAVSRDMGQLIVDACRAAPISTDYFSQVAAEMVQADQARNAGRYRTALTSAFVERGILSVDSAIAMAAAPIPRAVPLRDGAVAPSSAGGALAMGSPTVYTYADEPYDDAFRRGFGETPELPRRAMSVGGFKVEVYAPDQPPRFDVAPALVGAGNEPVPTVDAMTRLFVERLIQRREVNLGEAASAVANVTTKDATRVTHSLVAEGGAMVLKRNHFSCVCRGGIASRSPMACS